MVGITFTDHQIGVGVVSGVSINVMHDGTGRQWVTECADGNSDMTFADVFSMFPNACGPKTRLGAVSWECYHPRVSYAYPLLPPFFGDSTGETCKSNSSHAVHPPEMTVWLGPQRGDARSRAVSLYYIHEQVTA